MRQFILIALLASPTFAALPLYEGFVYPDGQVLLGQTNPGTGTSWLLAAATGTTTTTGIVVVNGTLTAPSGLPAAAGNSVDINGIGNLSGASNRLAFVNDTTTQITSGTVYYSFLLRVKELTGSNQTIGGFFITLNNTGNTATTQNPTSDAARIQMRIDPSDASKYNIGVFRNVNATAGATSWSGPLDVHDAGNNLITHFVVASYEIVTGTQNDIARLWLDPDPSTFGDDALTPAPTLIDNTTGTGTDIPIASIILRQSPAPYMTLDEVRIGTSWSAVTPLNIPCPDPIFDADSDGDVDMDDFGKFQICFGTSASSAGCHCFDKDGSGTIDGPDFISFTVCAPAGGLYRDQVPADPACDN